MKYYLRYTSTVLQNKPVLVSMDVDLGYVFPIGSYIKDYNCYDIDVENRSQRHLLLDQKIKEEIDYVVDKNEKEIINKIMRTEGVDKRDKDFAEKIRENDFGYRKKQERE